MSKFCKSCNNIVPFKTINDKLIFECNSCHIVTETLDEDLCIESDFKPKDHESKRVILSAEDPARYLESKPCKCSMPYRAVTLTPSMTAFLVCPGCKTVEPYN